MHAHGSVEKLRTSTRMRFDGTVAKATSFVAPSAPFSVSHFGSYRGIALSSWVFPQERDPGLRSFADHTQPVLELDLRRTRRPEPPVTSTKSLV